MFNPNKYVVYPSLMTVDQYQLECLPCYVNFSSKRHNMTRPILMTLLQEQCGAVDHSHWIHCWTWNLDNHIEQRLNNRTIFLPTTYVIRGQVMFSQVFVCRPRQWATWPAPLPGPWATWPVPPPRKWATWLTLSIWTIGHLTHPSPG